MARRNAPRIPDALLDQLLASADPRTAFDANGLIEDLKKALAISGARRTATAAAAMATRR